MGRELNASMRGVVAAVHVRDVGGAPHAPPGYVELLRGVGIAGDASAGTGHRQVCVLAEESLVLLPGGGQGLTPGSFGENLVTRGIDLRHLAEGRRVRVGDRAVLQVTEGVGVAHGLGAPPRLYARVARSGPLRAGDVIATDADLDRIRVAVLTLSDRGAAGDRRDESGVLLAAMLGDALGVPPVVHDLLADDLEAIRRRLIELADDVMCDLVVTTGGTGLSPRDVTPEATRAVIDREVPGIAEAIRAGGVAKNPRAMLSRGVCGQRGATLILNLSGSPRAVREQLAIVFPVLLHAVAVASGIPQDCGQHGAHARP
jgi:molybdenum cofactor synthesis domain-containing protein